MTDYTDDGEIDLDTEEAYLRDGTRLTNARAAQLAKDSLATLRRGRPSLSEGPQHSPHVSFRVPEQTRRLLDERARAEGRTPPEIAREALDRYMDSPTP